MLPFSEKVKVLNFISKKKSYAEVTKICSKNKSSHEIMKKEKEICATFAVTKVTATIQVLSYNGQGIKFVGRRNEQKMCSN